MDKEQAAAERLMRSFFKFKKIHWQKNHNTEGIKPGEFPILFLINRLNREDSKGARVSELSQQLHVATPTATQLINRLEISGFVRREADSEDRRSVRITLTEKGQMVVTEAHSDMLNHLNGLVEFLGSDDTEKLIELMDKIFIYFKENTPFDNRA